MRVLLKNPCPEDPDDRVFWGDYHFGRSLCHGFESLGCGALEHYWPNWGEPAEADLLLVMRGIREIGELPGTFGRRAVWIISHPEDVDEAELAPFDLVLCASTAHADALREKGFNAHPFLQCTDERAFHPGERDAARLGNAFVFVGNTRGKIRTLVEKAMDAELPLRIWGRGWRKEREDRFLVEHYKPNQELGALYRDSYCSVNDHYLDMTAFDYVNNRLFDALACALPVITEPHAGMQELAFEGVKIIHADEPFDEAIDEFVVNYEAYQEGAFRDSARILEEHTFTARAKRLLELL